MQNAHKVVFEDRPALSENRRPWKSLLPPRAGAFATLGSGNANLIKKIYFPREIFPLTSVITKAAGFGINSKKRFRCLPPNLYSLPPMLL